MLYLRKLKNKVSIEGRHSPHLQLFLKRKWVVVPYLPSCSWKSTTRIGPILFFSLGLFPTIVVSSSEIAKFFLKTHDLIFVSQPLGADGRLVFFNFNDVFFTPPSLWSCFTRLHNISMSH